MSRTPARWRDWNTLVELGRVLVTGNISHDRTLAEELDRGGDGFVLDIGCGEAPLLRFTRPERYVGLDEHTVSLDRARRRHAGHNAEFLEVDVTQVDLKRWNDADAVVISFVLHHLSDDQVRALIERVADDVAPDRILIQEAQPRGRWAPLLVALDGGDHFRSPEELESVIGDRHEVRHVATWSNRFRSFRYFLIELSGSTEASRVSGQAAEGSLASPS